MRMSESEPINESQDCLPDDDDGNEQREVLYPSESDYDSCDT